MRRHKTKEPIGPATAPRIEAPMTARQNSSSMALSVVFAMCVPLDRAGRRVAVVVMMAVERDLIRNAGPEQLNKRRILRHRLRIAFAADVLIEADDVIGRGHHHMQIVADQKDAGGKLAPK